MREEGDRLLDILEAIESIKAEASKGRAVFDEDRMIQVWILHHIQIIGEAAGRLSESLRTRYPDIPWADIASMRNVLVHHYFGIDLNEVWNTVENDLPAVERWVERVLQEGDY